jgi:hypothetical protein
MYGAFNLWDRLKSGFAFSPEEVKSLLIIILVFTFILGFNDGRKSFVFSLWLLNFLNILLVVTLSILVREFAHRVSAASFGMKAELRLSGVLLGIAAVFSLFTAASITTGIPLALLIYGGFVLNVTHRQRIGYFRFGLSFKDMAGVAFFGNFASLMLALLFKIFSFLPNPLIQTAMVINLILACLNMLPIPPLTGSSIFFASRTGYVFCLGLIVAASALMLTTSVLATVIGSVIIAGLLGLCYHIFLEMA